MMETFFVDGKALQDAMSVHLTLKVMLKLPEYYGCNLDALNDCLSGRRPIRLYVAHMGNEAVAAELRRVAMVIEDNDGEAVLPE